ncbi:endonuclease domain-containing protein [Desulfobotulus sp.]|uniref:endonuclease domain-containing protein n=1 Tax=Desulfobotulus sp. TaxID=1940337 RepID=UPI002A3619E6|nr:endonuclease domain-containing protein [Desulfobotulus sp.]MDY0164673.1 endonuclease domain-containing protein [Desulfobotulus sp.]
MTKENPIPSEIRRYARDLRQNQTDAETFFWALLRGRRFSRMKFRRQHPFGRYILDFYCHERKLVIELDGGQHNGGMAEKYDEERTLWLEQQGIWVLRFWNHEVLQETEAVLEVLWDSLYPHPRPLSQGERGRG